MLAGGAAFVGRRNGSITRRGIALLLAQKQSDQESKKTSKCPETIRSGYEIEAQDPSPYILLVASASLSTYVEEQIQKQIERDVEREAWGEFSPPCVSLSLSLSLFPKSTKKKKTCTRIVPIDRKRDVSKKKENWIVHC